MFAPSSACFTGSSATFSLVSDGREMLSFSQFISSPLTMHMSTHHGHFLICFVSSHITTTFDSGSAIAAFIIDVFVQNF